MAERRAAFLGVVVVIYTHLWILEGALRKWVPGTDEIMYFARDGLLCLAIFYAAVRFPMRGRGSRAALVGVLALVLCSWAFAAALFSESAVLVVLIGIRAYLAPVLLIYIVWANDLGRVWRRMLRIVLFYAPVQAALVIAQVLSPLSSFVNVGAGGAEAKFTTSDGVARATGTFTFSQGLTTYATLAFAIAVGCMLSRVFVTRIVYAAVALAACVVLIAISGSRGLVLIAALVLVVLLLHKVPTLRGSDVWRFGLMVAIGLVSWLSIQTFLPQVLEAFGTRFENAAGREDPILRLMDSGLGFLFEPFGVLGSGAGSHSQAGIAAGSLGRWLEDEPRRWAAELGVLGYLLGVLRVVAGLAMLGWAIFRRANWDSLSTGLAAAIALQLLIGSVTATPSSQGAFAIAVSALISLRCDSRRMQSDHVPLSSVSTTSRTRP